MDDLLIQQTQALLSKDDWLITNLSNAAALLKQSLNDVNWAGFYLLKGKELLLGPFQGKTACTRIPLGKGVCGTAALQNQTLRVDDIRQFQAYIACDSSTRSEIVIPIHSKNGTVVGVLDIDSASENRFSEKDRNTLEKIAQVIETVMDSSFNFSNLF